jgi:hypothetical protein
MLQLDTKYEMTSALQKVKKTNRTIDWGHRPLVSKRNSAQLHHTTCHSRGKEMSKCADSLIYMSGIQSMQLLVSSLEISMRYSLLHVAGGHKRRRYVDIWAPHDALRMLTLTSWFLWNFRKWMSFIRPGLSLGKGGGGVWCIQRYAENKQTHGSDNYFVRHLNRRNGNIFWTRRHFNQQQ